LVSRFATGKGRKASPKGRTHSPWGTIGVSEKSMILNVAEAGKRILRIGGGTGEMRSHNTAGAYYRRFSSGGGIRKVHLTPKAFAKWNNSGAELDFLEKGGEKTAWVGRERGHEINAIFSGYKTRKLETNHT